jgi:hypothetical protein
VIVRGDRLAESERVNRLRLDHAGMWALVLSNPRLVDDFGLLRWDAAFVVTALFPRRTPAPLRAVRSFMKAVEELGLVATFEVERVRFAEVWAWSSTEPAKRRWHRSPLPPWRKHESTAVCAKSGARLAVTWKQELSHDSARTNAPDVDPDVDPPFGSPTSSGPLGSSRNGRIDGDGEEGGVLEKGANFSEPAQPDDGTPF